ARLAALGCLGPDAPVALLLERDPSLVVGVYGALAAGGCYVPLEPDYPLERIKTVVEDAGCSVVVTQQRLAVVPLKFGADDAGGLDVFGGGDRDDCGAGARAPTTTPGHLVYIFYTSGTTGKPKGVAVEHRGLVRRIAWFDRLYPLKAGRDAMLLKTTYTFGISEWELFWAPTTGATTVVANNEGHRFASYVADIMLAGDVTACCFVPSALAALCETLIGDHPGVKAKVRVAISCGEALPAATAKLFFQAFDGGAKLNNVYGPTEADMTYYEMDRATALAMARPPPIGRPMDNVTAYLLDERLRPVPAGAPGHLHFGAPHACRGYVNLPDANAKAWVKNPFKGSPYVSSKTPVGDKLYATGDLARWLPSGDLAFCGRVAVGQIKLRGFRIELDDVAAALRAHHDVGSSAAALLDAGTPRAKLVGYETPHPSGNHRPPRLGKPIAPQLLPAYAAPSVVVQLDAMPVTSRGKLDRKRLPPPPADLGMGEGDFVPCESRTEKVIEAVWQELLGYDDTPISALGDFVALGGNSLLAGRATTRLRLELGLKSLPGTAMYMHPTIQALA
ncbi:hypothetical protein AURANDRAFT_10430, partial [Aureococcus anophagefferens]